MDLEYDQKFEEMKKYIPFLESMIKRLESTNNGVNNPRKAQLDKIRSLRDLLLDKKKRMKMENLLKCEQVLVNLYAKVEQRDSMADVKEDSTLQTQNDKSDLNTVRNKLKSVASKLHDDAPDTLPEIARATNTEVVCTPGSKEPALFQRRPNKVSPLRQSSSSHNDDNSSSSKRNYTRVLMSPEHKKKEWLANSDTNTDKPLFSRRSPRRSPRRYSPSYKKERKKSSKQRSKSSQHSKDLNITLKVPQESLGSLNTKDILSRIINCSDNDVDIDTLRGLRSQILGELKQTGTKDDISDLILKSYKKKEKRSKKKDDVEEGELSDSESEAIENIYGSLIVVNQGEGNSNISKSDKKKSRNIQICLVINSDKETVSKVNDQVINTDVDITDFETYTENKAAEKTALNKTGDKIRKEIEEKEKNTSLEEMKSPLKVVEDSCKSSMKETNKIDKPLNSPQEKPKPATEAFKLNFYQPTTEENTNLEESPVKQSSCKSSDECIIEKKDVTISKSAEVFKSVNIIDSSTEAQMKKEVVSEIDILQALKKEILGETTTVPLPEVVTPPLHQPKVMKVTSAQEIVSKKRISIEKYKQKAVPSVKQPLYKSVKQHSSSKDDNAKKQSLKLTEKECERFNFPVNVSPVDSSEDEDKQGWDFDLHQGTTISTDPKNSHNFAPDFEFHHGDSVPKSPDHEDFADTGIRPPVIIPSDPVKNIVPSAKADIDMRLELPTALNGSLDGSRKSTSLSSVTSEKIFEATWNEKSSNDVKVRKSNPEHRLRTECTAKNSPKSSTIESERMLRPNTSYSNVPSLSANIPPLMSLTHMTQPQNPNVITNINPIMTPIINSKIPLLMTPTMTPGLVPSINPSMTPSRMIPGMNPMMTPILTPNARSYEMTPRPNFEIDDYSNPKHVYAPMFPTFEPHDFSEKDSHHVNQTNENITWEERNCRSTSVQRDVDYHRNRNDRFQGDKRLDGPQIRMECPATPTSSFGRMECPSTPNPSFGRMDCPPTPNPSFGRMDCPPTPNASFGRMECPSTPNASFGRMDCPSTPNPSFGRMECPPTPNPSFGRMETPMTPVHSFGRSDCPMTPSHPFGRSDANMTQANAYGRGDYRNSSSFNHNYMKSQDPRLNRSSDYDKCQNRNDERNRLYFEDDRNVNENANRYRISQVESYEQDSRNSRECMPRRESSVGRSLSRDYERNEPYNKDYNNDYHYRRDKYKYTDEVSNRRNYRARSIGRTNTLEENFSKDRKSGVAKTYTREGSIEKPISVQSHTGRSFNIDTSFSRTFQETKSSLNTSFDARRQRASSVGRALRGSPLKDSKQPSTDKSKFELSDVSNRKAMQFRRASSVGRELKDYNSNKNFKDIKEDLRSCKFNNYHFDLQNRDHKSKSRISYSHEKVSSNEYYSNRDARTSNPSAISNRDACSSNTSAIKSSGHKTNNDPRRRGRDLDNISKTDDTSKYSPRKNFRDPRMRRELDIKNTSKDKYKDKDRHSSNASYKNYGIVYSSDNIAKGTILASAAGVKNFKIPKIKRAIEEKETETSSQVETDAKNETPLKNAKKCENAITDQSKKAETKSTRSDTNVTNKRHDIEIVNKNIPVNVDKSKSREDTYLLSKSSDDSKSQDENTYSVSSISDGCERRITRSALKGGTPSKQIGRISPVKKPRRIKKLLIYDSDSDSQENVSTDENAKKNIDVNKKLHSTETLKIDLLVDKGKATEKPNMKQDDATDRKDVKSGTNENGATIDVTREKKLSDNIKENSTPAVTNESFEAQNDSLDISFGVDDDLFSDNIASGSVLDNINALIADLDHDIEAPKINDFNDKFINNIVGNISSNNSIFPMGGQRDFASDVTLNDKFGFVVDVQNAIKCNTDQDALCKENRDATKINKNNPEYTNDLTQSGQMLSIQHESKEIKNNETKASGQIITQKNDKIDILEKYVKSTSEIQEVINYVNAEALVSTTALDDKSDGNVKDSQCLRNKTVESIYRFVPDSTNNSSENNIHVKDKDEQESVPDSTNELASEMNITSSHNSNDTFKEQSDANSTCADNLPRIDSISKLLSILEDKNKIKELLTMLSKGSGENEKIKKKLEKLSEIVSVEEENSEEVVNKDTNNQKNQIFARENNEKLKDIVAVQLQNDDNDVVDNKQVDNDNLSDEENLVVSGTIPTGVVMKYEGEKKVNNEFKKIDEIQESIVTNDKENVIINKDSEENKLLPDKKKTSDNCVEKEHVTEDKDDVKDTSINKEAEETKTHENIKDVINTVKCDEKISNENAKESIDTVPLPVQSGKKITKKSKITKRGRSRLAKKLSLNKDKRITRSEAGFSPQILPVPKKPSRELLKLQEDIRDMFISEDILNATGIRMCRLAKFVDDKNSKGDTPTTEVEPEPIVVLENIKSKMVSDESHNFIEKNKKKTSKSKSNQNEISDLESKGKSKYKPGPKSKTKKQDDPYIFETESVGESNNTGDSIDQNMDSDSDSVSTKSCGSSELLVELKKKTKRKRRSWQLGVIKKKNVKTKSVVKNAEFSIPTSQEVVAHETKEKITYEIPDINCFTDKSYCFHKNVKIYVCRLCGYRGNDIVPHYKKNHPHSEIPLSRLSPGIAKEAIEQCENMNLQAISKIHTTRYVCRFCFQEFHRHNTALEAFFWHVVSVHTGEYKHICSECINVTRCPFHLDIPPPPKNLKGQLIGYICGRCNFTQVSLENLKTHVIVRHDDEQTEVYSINLGEIPRKVLQSLVSKAGDLSNEGLRVLRSTRSNQSTTEPSDDHSDVTDSTDRIVGLDNGQDNIIQEITPVSPKPTPKNKFQSKFIFENDDNSDASSYSKNEEVINASIKREKDDDTQDSHHNDVMEEAEEALEPAKKPVLEQQPPLSNIVENADVQTELTPSTDVLDYPHFKIKLTGTGTKEYICCINGLDNHYKTTLLISFKKHVQLKHSENWDGYCFVCKVIVTSQGKHTFKDCLQHFLDKHIDNFPIFEEIPEPIVEDVPDTAISIDINDAPTSKPYINVRPLSELISTEQSETQAVHSPLPKIQSVVSLGTSDESSNINSESQKDDKVYNYEQTQTEVMTKKHLVVLEAMLTPEKLVQVFKCAGRFCSYTTDNAEEALVHASTHQRIGGECSLKCTYCDFDCSGNAIDLVMHVFKNYKHCSYACSKCFYRAAASQLVYAHIKRVHTEFDADKVPVLSSATVVKDNSPDDLMSRDEAVLHYICNNRDPDEGGTCQFKSYVLTKFREHLQTRHANDQEYSCYMCNTSTPSSKLLAQHLKSHGLRIYQCCRCLFGADNETELLAHASEKHPIKQPKAYLRIITSKGGSSEVRVLPLAVLSKSSVESTIISPSVDKESPVKQAERSIDLEKLIGQTNLMIESMHTITNAATIEPVNVAAKEDQIQQLENEDRSRPNSRTETERSSPAVLTLLSEPQDTSLNITPNVTVKIEPVESEPKTSEVPPVASTSAPSDPDVVCLDSDEEISRQNIIDLSGDDVPVELNTSKKQEDTDVKISRACLYKCSKCSLLSKSEGMFKRHIISCFPNSKELMKCAFCLYTAAANRIVIHYNTVHLESTMSYSCAKCKGKFVSLPAARKHMKLIHNEISTIVNSKMLSTGFLQYVIDSDYKERQAPKRKLSSETGKKNSEPAPKLKKYGPLDVDKLPINPILDDLVYCSLCEFNTKVRLNMVRHLQLHAEQQPVPRTAPVNPVPHLESHEKHFDKMLNLASSSITTSSKTSVAEHMSPEAASIYPKFVPEKQRYTCGAKWCSYISVNESMFKIHWETLHAGTNDYHCVHCPPHQHLDTSKPLSAVRIIAHLKMHDMKLYACSSCTFYHYTRKLLEKHLREVHTGRVIIVREEGASAPPTPAPAQSSTAPTMDLKPWQCGLCKFKSMIRPEVIEHCSKFHQSKMQFKCTYCGFRTSNIENISKHQSKQHPGKKEEVFYFYYREGSIPDEADGVARWQKQSQKNESEIKTESEIPPVESVPILPKPAPAKPAAVNLDIVKKEVVEPETEQAAEGVDDLCKSFGQFCDPNGLKYKCPLCKVIIEDTKEAMQSHLYEELQYRKWGCAVCSYKAFHKPGLQQHVHTEHGHSREAKEPIELQVENRIETWVAKLLGHQTTIIERNKENLVIQKSEILRANPSSSAKVVEKPAETVPPTSSAAKPNVTMAELEKLFGPFGVPSNMNYTCPKCNISARAEAVMQEHLESELNKIRWCCNVCNDTFQTYHEAQFHCRSVHAGQSSRPVEATRDVSLRAAWVSAVLRVQKLSMNYMPVTEPNPPVTQTPAPTENPPENSLLVVRYEEKVPTPEEQMKLNKKTDTDDVNNDKSAPDEAEKKKTEFECQYCSATYKYESFFHGHILKHYGLKPFTCPYCPHTDYKKTMETHIRNHHPNRSVVHLNTPIPTNSLVHDNLKTSSTTKPIVIDIETKIICLSCEEAMTRAESLTHYHDNVRPQFGMKGTVVYRCWSCLTLHKSSTDFNTHHKQFHPNEKKNSSFYKLQDETRCLYCSLCNQNFGTMAQYRLHQQTKHGLKSCTPIESSVSDIIDLVDDVETGKRKAEDTSILPVPKRVARKSTTKLPSMAVARKSTTKLPFDVPCDDEEYSFYGTRPSMDNLENVTTLMPFYNTFVPFTLKKLSEIIKIYPVVVVKDINEKQ